MLNDAKARQIFEAIAAGPIGQQLEKQFEEDRAKRCAELRAELESGQAKYLAQTRELEQMVADAEAQVAELKKALEQLEKEHLRLVWRLSDKRGAAIEHRDRHWRELEKVADPRIATYRREFERRLGSTARMVRALKWKRDLVTADNRLHVEVAGQYLLTAIEATTRWAREGLTGDEVDSAYRQILGQFPRIPMKPGDTEGSIPEPISE